MNRANAITSLLWLSAIALVTWILKDLPLAAMTQGLRQLTLGQWSLWLVLNVLVVALSTLRWHILIAALKGTVNFFNLTLIRLAGQTISFVTPGPQFGGEPMQVFWLYKRQGLPLHKAILSLGLDRFLELWVNFAVLLLGAILLLLSPRMAFADWNQIALSLLLLLLAIPILLLSLLRRPQWLTRRLSPLFARWLSHPRLATLKAHKDAFEDDLRSLLLQRKRVLMQALFISIFNWGIILAELWLLLYFAQVTVDIESFTLIALAIRLAMLLPLPGGIGTIEAALIWSMQMLDYEISDALVLIALMRLRDTLILVAGAGSLVALRAKPDEPSELAT